MVLESRITLYFTLLYFTLLTSIYDKLFFILHLQMHLSDIRHELKSSRSLGSMSVRLARQTNGVAPPLDRDFSMAAHLPRSSCSVPNTSWAALMTTSLPFMAR